MSKYSDFLTEKFSSLSNSIQGNESDEEDFKNSLPHHLSGDEISLINGIMPDKGFGKSLTDPTTYNYEKTEMVDLDDCVKVRRTIENCRKAMKIEPFCRASALMMVILVSSDFEIYGEEGADEDVLNKIQDIARDVWELETKIFGMSWRAIVDGRFFLNKVQDKSSKNLLVDFLAYDAKDYDFIKIQNPLNQEVKGYVQKAKVWKYPENWDERDENNEPIYSFEELANPKMATVSVPLKPDQVIHDEFFEDGEGLVMCILDDVFALKDITNAHPDIIKAQLGLIFIQMGSENYPFTPYEDTDPIPVQTRKLQQALNHAQKTFTKALNDGLAVGTQTTNPKFVGTSNMGALNLSFATNIHAHRIFIGLLTPPGRWEGSGTNKASIETQIGDGGQYSAVYYIQNRIKRLIERDLINHQIELLEDEFGEKAKSSVDKIKIRFRIKNLEDRKKLAEVFKIIEEISPHSSEEELMNLFEVYAPEYHKKIKEKSQVSISKADYSKDDKIFDIPDEIEIPDGLLDNQLMNGFIDTSKNSKMVNGLRNYLIDKGVFNES